MIIRALKETINDLNEELIMLEEINGELPDEANVSCQKRIDEIKRLLKYEARR